MVCPHREAASPLETDLYPPIKTHLEKLGLKVKGEVCGCDLVGLSDGAPELVVIGEMKQSFTLELVLQAVDRTSACDEVWLAVGASKRGRGRENDARVKKLCRFLGFGLLTVTAEGRVDVVTEPAPWKPRRDAKRRSRIVEEHRRRNGDPVAGGSTRLPQMTAYRQQALAVANALAGRRVVRETFGYSLRTRPRFSGQWLRMVRADRAWALRADLVRPRRACHVGRPLCARVRAPTAYAYEPSPACFASACFTRSSRLRPVYGFASRGSTTSGGSSICEIPVVTTTFTPGR